MNPGTPVKRVEFMLRVVADIPADMELKGLRVEPEMLSLVRDPDKIALPARWIKVEQTTSRPEKTKLSSEGHVEGDVEKCPCECCGYVRLMRSH